MKHITLCNCLCCSSPFSPSSCSSRDFASVIQNIGKFGEKSCFTDHQTANTIYHFRDSVRSLKETSRHIKLSHTNIALLLQEATQKYHKLTDYWTKSCYLSLCPSLCLLRFALPSSSLQVFSFFRSLTSSQVIIREIYSFVFLVWKSFSSSYT